MSILRYLAAPLAPFYGLAVRARNRAFDAHPDGFSAREAHLLEGLLDRVFGNPLQW